MHFPTKALLALLAIAGSTNFVHAAAQTRDTASELRATGLVGEQSDGYLGVVGSAPAAVRAQVDAINIRRRARYANLAARRGARLEEVAAAAACEILATRVQPGQYYRIEGTWRQRQGNEPVARPPYCR